MGSNPRRKIPLLGIAHLVERIYLFQVLEVHPGMGRISDRRGKEMAICGLIMYFCKNLGKRPSFG